GELGQLPAVLAAGVAEQAAEVGQGAAAGFGAGEARADARRDGAQLGRPALHVRGRRSVLGHGSSSRGFAAAILSSATVGLRLSDSVLGPRAMGGWDWCRPTTTLSEPARRG